MLSDALTQGISRDSNVRLDREIQSRTQKASSDTHSARGVGRQYFIGHTLVILLKHESSSLSSGSHFQCG